MPLSLGQNHKTLNVFGMQPEYQQDVTKTGNGQRGAGSGERGTGNGERKSGNELSAETSTKSKMAVQKTRKRKKKTKTGIRSCLG